MMGWLWYQNQLAIYLQRPSSIGARLGQKQLQM